MCARFGSEIGVSDGAERLSGDDLWGLGCGCGRVCAKGVRSVIHHISFVREELAAR